MAGARVRVMLVDDHPLMRRGVRELLERQGTYDIVGEAANGADALALAAELRPDLIVSDVNLPDVDGIDLLATLLAGCVAVPANLRPAAPPPTPAAARSRFRKTCPSHPSS